MPKRRDLHVFQHLRSAVWNNIQKIEHCEVFCNYQTRHTKLYRARILSVCSESRSSENCSNHLICVQTKPRVCLPDENVLLVDLIKSLKHNETCMRMCERFVCVIQPCDSTRSVGHAHEALEPQLGKWNANRVQNAGGSVCAGADDSDLAPTVITKFGAMRAVVRYCTARSIVEAFARRCWAVFRSVRIIMLSARYSNTATEYSDCVLYTMDSC